jgi:hypothetical protein
MSLRVYTDNAVETPQGMDTINNLTDIELISDPFQTSIFHGARIGGLTKAFASGRSNFIVF